MQDDSSASEDEAGDGAPVRRHHLKFNSRCSHIEINSKIGHNQSVMKSVGSSMGGAGLPHPDTKCLGLKDAHRLTHPHLPKDNEEVNAHVKHL
jgi:hypothetical protein